MFERLRYLDFIILFLLLFLVIIMFIGPLNLKIENLEKFHINDTCHECGKNLY